MGDVMWCFKIEIKALTQMSSWLNLRAKHYFLAGIGVNCISPVYNHVATSVRLACLVDHRC